uniref:PH domain-containing protein n=1 Tax=Globisporangium ultimum (strain ATCC 200006 / CBS 805.95 / DAOM BR144) TaxID=431595 RepID=K3WU92_GLOUD
MYPVSSIAPLSSGGREEGSEGDDAAAAAAARGKEKERMRAAHSRTRRRIHRQPFEGHDSRFCEESRTMAAVVTTTVAAAKTPVDVPPQLDFAARRKAKHTAVAAEPEAEPELMDAELEMPGTPPFNPDAATLWEKEEASNSRSNNTSPSTKVSELSDEADLSSDRMQERHDAANCIQRASRGFLAKRCLANRLSAVGRPVELRITQVQNLEMLCDFRDVNSIYCNVRVLKRPFGPFMFQFSTSKSTNVNLPTWTDTFFVPMLSSRCDLVVTLVGVTVTNKQRFLGQAIAQLEPGWEKIPKMSAPLAKWKFPVEESLLGLHRFVTGMVNLEIAPVSSRLSCKAGQFLMAPPISSRPSGVFSSFWTRKVTISTPSPQTPNNPASASPARKSVVTRWGVLTDTSFHLFDNSSAKLLISFDLAKIQLIQSNPDSRKSDPNRLFPVKIYSQGTLYVFYVSTYAQQQAWEYKIDLHRRKLLIP